MATRTADNRAHRGPGWDAAGGRCGMSFTWNLDAVLINSQVKRQEYLIDEKLLPPTGWARPTTPGRCWT